MCMCFKCVSWDSPEAMKDNAMEDRRLLRRGCLQYLEDLGLLNKTDTIISTLPWALWLGVIVCVLVTFPWRRIEEPAQTLWTLHSLFDYKGNINHQEIKVLFFQIEAEAWLEIISWKQPLTILTSDSSVSICCCDMPWRLTCRGTWMLHIQSDVRCSQ